MPNTVLKNGKQKRNFIWKQVCKIVELLEPSLPRSPERPSLPRSPERPSLPRSPERHVTSRHDSRVPSPELGLGSCSPQVCWSSFYLCGSLWDLGHHILEMHTGASHIAICADNKIAIAKAKREAGIYYRVPWFSVCFVLVECETIVCFYEYDFESLYDPLGTFGEIERITLLSV